MQTGLILLLGSCAAFCPTTCHRRWASRGPAAAPPRSTRPSRPTRPSVVLGAHHRLDDLKALAAAGTPFSVDEVDRVIASLQGALEGDGPADKDSSDAARAIDWGSLRVLITEVAHKSHKVR